MHDVVTVSYRGKDYTVPLPETLQQLAEAIQAQVAHRDALTLAVDSMKLLPRAAGRGAVLPSKTPDESPAAAGAGSC